MIIIVICKLIKNENTGIGPLMTIDEETKLVRRKFALMEAMQLVAVFTDIVVS